MNESGTQYRLEGTVQQRAAEQGGTVSQLWDGSDGYLTAAELKIARERWRDPRGGAARFQHINEYNRQGYSLYEASFNELIAGVDDDALAWGHNQPYGPPAPWELCGDNEAGYKQCLGKGWTFDELFDPFMEERVACLACQHEPRRYTPNMGIPVGKFGCALHPVPASVAHFAKQGEPRRDGG